MTLQSHVFTSSATGSALSNSSFSLSNFKLEQFFQIHEGEIFGKQTARGFIFSYRNAPSLFSSSQYNSLGQHHNKSMAHIRWAFNSHGALNRRM